MHGVDVDRVYIECEDRLIACVDVATLSSFADNLLDNAICHGVTTAGAPVMISARTALGSVRIESSNHAQSLTDDDLAHLFELFWRENDSRHDRRGFGLGPAVARTLARASGGDIVATRCGSDTLTFSITMPISSESVSDLPSEGADLLSRIMKR